MTHEAAGAGRELEPADHPWGTTEPADLRGEEADDEAERSGDAGADEASPEDPVGNDNIREGRVGGLMGGPRLSQGQGQGG